MQNAIKLGNGILTIFFLKRETSMVMGSFINSSLLQMRGNINIKWGLSLTLSETPFFGGNGR